MNKQSPYLNPIRYYRKLESPYIDEQKIQIIQEETDVLITLPSFLDTEEVGKLCHDFITCVRTDLKKYIALDPKFFHSLTPIKAQEYLKKENKLVFSSLIQAMCDVSFQAEVGPFAAVAGSIAQITATMLYIWINQKIESNKAEYKKESINIIVENGGDIYMYSSKDRVVGVLAKPDTKENIGIKIKANSCPLAFCASSSIIGHSLSFGNGDIAMVMAKNAALADALATSYCNSLKTSKDIDIVLERAQKDFNLNALHEPFCHKEIKNFLQKQLQQIVAKNKTNYQDIDEKNINTQRKKNAKTVHESYSKTYLTQESGVLGVFLQCDNLMGAWGDIELVML